MPFDGHLQGALALICPVVSWGRERCGDSERAGKLSSQCEGQHSVRLKSSGLPPPHQPCLSTAVFMTFFWQVSVIEQAFFCLANKSPRLPCLGSENDPGVVDF